MRGLRLKVGCPNGDMKDTFREWEIDFGDSGREDWQIGDVARRVKRSKRMGLHKINWGG